MKILVTGGLGFVGRNLTNRLLKEGYDVTVTACGDEPLIKGLSKVLYCGLDGIDWDCIKGQDVVFHQMANNDTQFHDSQEMTAANLNGPAKLFKIAAEGGCKKFIYASSTAVYGNSPAPYTEDSAIDLLTPYAKSKHAFDIFAMGFAREFNVSVTGLRYCNVYGPGEELKRHRMSMIGQLLHQIRQGLLPTVYEDGEQKRDWVHVADVVECNLLAMMRQNSGEIYNVGSGASSSFNEILDILKKELFVDCQTRYIKNPFQGSYQNHTECNIEKARKELGFNPSFDIKSGISHYVANI